MNYTAIAIVFIIFLVAYEALTSGWGAALWNALGFFGMLLGSFLRNPVLWLFGLGLLYLLGPAILEISVAALKSLYENITAAEEADDALAPEDKLSPAEKVVVVERLEYHAEVESIESSNADAAEKAQAKAAAAEKYTETVAKAVENGEITEEDADAAEEFADDIVEDGVRTAAQKRSVRRATARRAACARTRPPGAGYH